MSDDAHREDAGTTDPPAGGVGGLKARATATWQSWQDRYLWLRHVLEAWQLLGRNNGNQYAAAITYFSFLALFPLLLLAVAITGFVLHAHPATQASLFAHLTQNVPGGFGDTLKSALQTAIKDRAAVGVVGLVGVLLSGLGWIGNLRQAIDGVWGRRPAKQNFVMSKVSNLLVLGGLGIGVLVSLALTVAGTSVTDQLLKLVGLDDVPGSTVLLKVIGIAVAVAGDMVIFWWLLVKLPNAEVDRSTAIKGALLASVGFEILKIVGTYTIAHASKSLTAGPFASIIAILVWIQLVARWMLFSCAWLATAHAARRAANQVPIVEPPVMVQAEQATAQGGSAISPATVGATLVGAGAVAGAVAHWAATRPRPDRD